MRLQALTTAPMRRDAKITPVYQDPRLQISESWYYLCVYIAYTQDDWVDHLPMAEFAASNHVNASTDMILFFADHGFHPCTGIESSRTFEGEQKAKLLAANKIVAW